MKRREPVEENIARKQAMRAAASAESDKRQKARVKARQLEGLAISIERSDARGTLYDWWGRIEAERLERE